MWVLITTTTTKKQSHDPFGLFRRQKSFLSSEKLLNLDSDDKW